MKFKNTLILFILLVVLIVAAVIIENPFSKKSEQKSEEEITALFPGFKIENASKIEIKQMGSESILEKKEGKWIVSSANNFPADSDAVQKLLENIRDFKTKEIVSKNTKKQNLFQVNDMMGIGVKVSDFKGNLLGHVYVGKNGPNFMTTYIRKEGSDNVILADGYLKTIFDKGRTSWKDMNIFKLDQNLIEYIRMESPTGKIVCEKDPKGIWMVKEPEVFEADKETVDKIAETLATLSTNDYPEKKELSAYGLDKPESNITFRTKDKKEFNLIVSKEDKNKFYAKKPDSDLIYSLYKYRITSIFKKVDELRKKTPEQQKAEEMNNPQNMQNMNPEQQKALMEALKKQSEGKTGGVNNLQNMNPEQRKAMENSFKEALKKQAETKAGGVNTPESKKQEKKQESVPSGK
jgi:hypothetical protein